MSKEKCYMNSLTFVYELGIAEHLPVFLLKHICNRLDQLTQKDYQL